MWPYTNGLTGDLGRVARAGDLPALHLGHIFASDDQPQGSHPVNDRRDIGATIDSRFEYDREMMPYHDLINALQLFLNVLYVDYEGQRNRGRSGN